jgi:hypothetical protein
MGNCIIVGTVSGPMQFLIIYDKDASKLVEVRKFENGQRQEAKKAYLDAAVEHSGRNYDVSLIDTKNEETLRKNWGRYFK